MNDIKFFKVSSSGKLDPMEASTKSLHHRRSILIEDSTNKTIWLIYGSGVSAKTKQSSEKIAKKIKSKLGSKYLIKSSASSENKKIVQDILSKPPIKKEKKEKIAKKKRSVKKREPVSKDKIPVVPIISSSNIVTPTLKGDTDLTGPEIEEFQIAYFEDDGRKTADSTVFSLSLKFLNEIQFIIDENYSKSKAKQKLNSIMDDLLKVIFLE